MRKLFHYLLFTLIVMPSLACTMPCNSSMPHAEKFDMDHDSMVTTLPLSNAKAMLLIDCMNSDLSQTSSKLKLQEATYNIYPLPDLQHDESLHLQRHFSDINSTLWPPAWSHNESYSPPLILTTQRFRI